MLICFGSCCSHILRLKLWHCCCSVFNELIDNRLRVVTFYNKSVIKISFLASNKKSATCNTLYHLSLVDVTCVLNN